MRDELDLQLLLAEGEQIAGLSQAPDPFPGFEMSSSGFRLRRIESTCLAHSAARSEALRRLESLRSRLSADPKDQVLGPAEHTKPEFYLDR